MILRWDGVGKTTGVFWKWSASYVDRKWNEATQTGPDAQFVENMDRRKFCVHNDKSYSRRKP